MDAILKIEAAGLPIAVYHHAQADGTLLPSESCICEDDVYTNNGDDDTIGVPLVRLSDALQTLAGKDAEIARLKSALEPFANIAYFSNIVDGFVLTLDRDEQQAALLKAFAIARAALTQPTEQPK